MNDTPWPRWIRLTVVVLATLILCSCRSPWPSASGWKSQDHSHPSAPPAAAPGEDLPAEAYSGPPSAPALRAENAWAWRPPGISGAWPKDEYIHDGGDYVLPARVRGDWSVAGLEQEDTVAHYDTLDDRTIVSPSNRVDIYAPRFGVVRRVDNLRANEAHRRLGAVEYPLKLTLYEDRQLATTAIQPIQPEGQVGAGASSLYRSLQKGGEVERRDALAAFRGRFRPFEDLSVIKRGVLDQAEKARLAIGVDAAIVWTGDQAVQVVLDGRKAQEVAQTEQLMQFYRFDEPKSPELRLIKVASKDSALPGETIDFTLRFDNTGRELIGNVVILDNLSTRLEYIPDSQQCSLPHDFVATPNAGGSQALRWELQNPLPPGEGGIIRFRCRLR